MTPNDALNVILSGHGARCDAGIAPCKRCDREHEATEVLRALISSASRPAPEQVHQLEIRRRESRQLLRRLVKYVREGAAVTPGTTRLARLTEQVDDYLNRTSEPGDILRSEAAPERVPTGEVTREHRLAAWSLVGEGDVMPSSAAELWSRHGGNPHGFNFDRENSVAQLLATREAAAYSRGKAEAERGESEADEAATDNALRIGLEAIDRLESGRVWRSVNHDVPDSDVWAVASLGPGEERDCIIAQLEFTDDSEGHGEPYWYTKNGDIALRNYPYWVPLPSTADPTLPAPPPAAAKGGR